MSGLTKRLPPGVALMRGRVASSVPDADRRVLASVLMPGIRGGTGRRPCPAQAPRAPVCSGFV
jgi:hypothetical protein